MAGRTQRHRATDWLCSAALLFMPQHPPSIDPNARALGLPPFDERLPDAWTSGAPPATERVAKSFADWTAWLLALAVLGFMTAFGFQALTWSLRGGWQWLWLLVGLPFFGVFSVSMGVFVVQTLRERRQVRVALEHLSLERGEGLRADTALHQRLRAAVPPARDGERSVAPPCIGVRLMQRTIRHAPDGRAVPVDECRDETVAHAEQAEQGREGRCVYAWTLHTGPAREGASQWFVALHDPAVPDGAPFLVAALRELPPR
jgi:hypothetical protein